MRAFIAIELPQETKLALAKLVEELKKTNADIKWVAPESLHLTLKFLGDIDDSQAETITTIIENVE